ncbi:MAG TPA: zf-HC2 domain-containing protein [Candidatus Eisenbacteria bacterium]|nr:zf-HC2 domain-containing protein [Candidatus Eisenbacteria bacterium]
MDCSEAKSHLSAFASGLTNDLDRSEIEEHLTTCEACSLEVELLRGRAAGQVSAPKPSDWTLEKIFGNEGGGDPAEGSRESSEPEAEAPIEHDARTLEAPPAVTPPARETQPPPPAEAPQPRPSLILPLPATPESDENRTSTKPAGAKAKKGSWDFEPADAGKDAAPPEESLLFAEQALNRKSGGATKSKAAAMRALIWSLGGIAGLGLLGVSVWIAMAVHQAPPREISTGAARSTPANQEPAPDDSTASDSSSAAPPSDQTLQARSLPLMPSAPALPDPTRAAGTPPASPSAPAAASSAPAASPSTKSVAANPKPARDAATPKKAAASAPAPAKPVKRDDDDMWPTDDPVHAGTSGSGSSSAKPPAAAVAPSTAVSPSTAAAPSTKPDAGSANAAPPATHAAPPPAASQPGGAAAPQPAPTAIDRLHLATEKAAADRDLSSLRQLKTAWKTLLRTTVGRDRSRTKREYADCLWAIQAQTGRDADRLECLNAYRDYLLSAPAGGTDTRSAERLRELEDAVRENN